MTRGYDDTVHVRLADQARPDGRDAPAQFLWRGRLYLVNEVLGYWRERQAWWSLEPAQAVHGLAGPGAGVGAGSAPSRPPAGSRAAQVGADREVWRVEAAAGRSADRGVYHLARDAGSPTATPRQAAAGTWRLLQVCD
jgi:hypothetical protein